MASGDGDPILELRGVSKTFPGTLALDSVDFDLRPGEVHALVGQNGSGKSTMIKILAGFHQPDPGAEIKLDGESVELSNTVVSHDLGLRFVHQELGLVSDLGAVENLALGEGYPTGFGGKIKWGRARRDARQRLSALGYDIDVRRPVSGLAAAERTGIAIARALHDWGEARILVLDEPTASLPSHEVSALFEAVSRVRDKGLGVIYISHRLDEVFEIANRVTPLRDGKVVGTFARDELDEARLVSLMCGDVELRPRIPTAFHENPEPLLEVESLRGNIVDGISFTVHRGEVLGIAGLTGSGREEILSMLFGALPRGGSVSVGGREIRPRSPVAAMDAKVAFVPADRISQGSVVEMTVRENCTLTDLKRHSRAASRLSKSAERWETRDWIQALDIRPDRPEAIFDSLSGGNQQKVMLAKWLRMQPSVILLDEPTQGVDVEAKATIHALARKAAADGAAVVIASSDDAEIVDTCDRVLVMRDGRVTGVLESEELSPEAIASVQLGGVKAATP
jgi:ribose transport system ATP-binding protein